MAVGLDFIQSQLKAIQSDLRELKFAADVDRRNATTLYNNLVAEIGATIGRLDVKVELSFEIVNERIDRIEGKVEGIEGKVEGIEGKVDRLEAKVDRLDAKIDAGFAKIEQLLTKG